MNNFAQFFMSRIRDPSGQSLIQLVFAMAITGILMTALLTLTINQSKETRALGERMATLELERLLLSSLAGNVLCTAELTNSALNSSAPYSIDHTNLNEVNIQLPGIHSSASPGAPMLITEGGPASPLSTTTVVDKILVTNFLSSGAPNNFMAQLRVNFNSLKLVRPIRPITIRVNITTNDYGEITACDNQEFGGGPVASGGPGTIHGRARWMASATPGVYDCTVEFGPIYCPTPNTHPQCPTGYMRIDTFPLMNAQHYTCVKL